MLLMYFWQMFAIDERRALYIRTVIHRHLFHAGEVSASRLRALPIGKRDYRILWLRGNQFHDLVHHGYTKAFAQVRHVNEQNLAAFMCDESDAVHPYSF